MTDGDKIKSTKKSFEILEIIGQSGGAKVTDIAEQIDISRTSIYKHLRTLEDIDAVDDREGEFVLGSKFKNGTLADNSAHYDSPKQSQEIDNLSYSLDAPVNWWVLDNDSCVCQYISLPNEGRANPRERNERRALVETPPGQVILASLSDSEREGLLETAGSEVDISDVKEQMQSVREREALVESIAPGDVEWFSINAPVSNPNGRPAGAIEIVIPAERAQGLDIQVNVVGLLLDTAKKLKTQ